MRKLTALALALTAGAGSGCGLLHRRAPAPPPVVIMEPPIVFPGPLPSSMPMPEEMAIGHAPAPAWLTASRLEIGRAPRLRRGPESLARTREKATPQATTVPNDSLRLSQSLSPAQRADYRNAALAVLQRTQGDLNILYTRNLDDTAAATRAQAAEYVEQARQALQAGDLVRARTLAGKAQTLTRFLLGQ